MNRCYLTCPPGTKQVDNAEELRDMWHSGYSFRVYRYHTDISNVDILKLKMSQFTHVCIVYVDKNVEVAGHDIEL